MNQRIRELQRVAEQDKSKDLHVFLDEAITELKPRTGMSKISELAAKISAAQKQRDGRVDQLMTRQAALSDKSDAVLAQHESKLAATEQEIQELEASLQDLPGHNNPPE